MLHSGMLWPYTLILTRLERLARGTNTAPYYIHSLVTAVKSFIALVPDLHEDEVGGWVKDGEVLEGEIVVEAVQR